MYSQNLFSFEEKNDKSSKHRFCKNNSTNITFKFISLKYLIGLKMYS